ncbi:MAG: HNH endonuclease [Chloroflexi bacterium]|nr:HNH endonuclease [Chloroflexota bacterium]
MADRRRWNRDELLVVLRMYFTLDFGQLHARHATVIQTAAHIGRGANSVAMKASNLASLDPAITSTGRKGLAGASAADRAIWAEYSNQWDDLAEDAASAWEAFGSDADLVSMPPAGASESLITTKVRRHQGFFRATVLANYQYRCAITGLESPALLNASHIIPWSVDISRRTDPSNGLALNALHDRAFDRGLISIDGSSKVIVSSRLKSLVQNDFTESALLNWEGEKLITPFRHPPNREALEYHRDEIFVA